MVFQFQRNSDVGKAILSVWNRTADYWLRLSRVERSEAAQKPRLLAAFLKKRQGRTFSGSIN
jgi:hypothetical protein